jgi:hypothetical protein
MKDDFYFLVLKSLKKSGLFKSGDLSNITKVYFYDQRNASSATFGEVNTDIDNYFNSMKESGHIQKFVNLTPPNTRYDSKGNYLSLIIIEANLTPAGLAFYNDHRNILVTRRISIIALIIAVISAAFSGWSNIKKVPPSQQEESQTQSSVNRKKYQQNKEKPKLNPKSFSSDSSHR